jgi:deazaflavin-dependent oxidoreductase (nitroreductase family)
MEPSFATERTKATIPEYRPSSWAIVHLVNPLTRLLVGKLGLDNDGVRILEVKGRNSGVMRATPVRLLELDGRSYLVALQGETQWVRNLRARGGGRLRLGHQIKEFRAAELADSEKLPVLQAYLRHWWSQSASLTMVSSPEAPDEEIMMAAPTHPVFRIDS